MKTRKDRFSPGAPSPHRRRWRPAALALSAALGAGGCSAGGDVAGLGATPGGEQDVGLFREVVDRGGVPQPSSFTVAGFLAEHDLPLEAPPCERPLCLQAGVGVARALDSGKNEVFVQLGFSSGVDEATFRRAPLNLAAVIDRSGSMAGEKIAAARTALHRLVDQLGPKDLFSLVIFDDRVDVLRRPGPIGDRAELHRLIDGIAVRGATDIERALRTGYELVAGAREAGSGRMERVILMTDAQPNAGRTGTEDFQSLVSRFAAQDVGLTAMGVGIDFGQELALSISRSRGGNYFFLSDAERVATIFDRDFDLIVTPLAYDLRVTLTTAPGYRVREVYGLPASPEGRSVSLESATVFLSRNRGALLARLQPTAGWDDGRLLAQTTLSYSGRDATQPTTEERDSGYGGGEVLGESTLWFSQRGVQRTVAVVNAAVATRRALEIYGEGRLDAALELLGRGEAELRAEQARAPSAQLGDDLRLLQSLGVNMSQRGGAYDYGYDRPSGSYHGHGLFGCNAAPGGAAPGGPAVALVGLALVLVRRRRA